jgi:hypothetical protein
MEVRGNDGRKQEERRIELGGRWFEKNKKKRIDEDQAAEEKLRIDQI